jgi:hypothetical protein
MGNYASACFGVEPDQGGTTLGERQVVRFPKHVRGDADLEARRRMLMQVLITPHHFVPQRMVVRTCA